MNLSIALGPSVIVVTINDTATRSTVSYKPSFNLSLAAVMNDFSMASSFLTSFEIVDFLSILPTNATEKLLLASRIKQRWKINPFQKLVGDGEQLCQMFSHSRIIVLERLQRSGSNFLQAIIKMLFC